VAFIRARAAQLSLSQQKDSVNVIIGGEEEEKERAFMDSKDKGTAAKHCCRQTVDFYPGGWLMTALMKTCSKYTNDVYFHQSGLLVHHARYA